MNEVFMKHEDGFCGSQFSNSRICKIFAGVAGQDRRAPSVAAVAAVVLTLLAGLVLGGCATVQEAQREPSEFTILQLNDVYEIFPVDVRVNGKVERKGGIAHVATLVDRYRDQGDVLLLHAGDIFSPSLLSGKLRYKGAQMVEALNSLGIDAATFGNHEFDFGCKSFIERLGESTFPWVAANVNLPQDVTLPAGTVEPYLILNRGGLRVGIFGVALPIQPISGCGTEAITFSDPIEAAAKSVASLREQGVDLIIALTHLRMEQDKALARAVPGIDVIIGGHEHEVLEALVGKTLITKAGANAFGLGEIGIRAASTGGKTPVIEKRWNWASVNADEIPADPKVKKILEPYREKMLPFTEEIGSSSVPLDALEETIREAESNIGNLLADIIRASLNADAAIINGGAVRDDRVVPPGPITLGDIHTMLPFSNEIVAVEITGKTLVKALENGVSLTGQKGGRFPQVSGIQFTFDASLPVGERILEASISGKKVDPEMTYTLATINFLVERGEIDGYTMLRLPILRKGGDLNEAIIKYFRENSPVCAAIEGRIKQAGSAGSSAATCR